MLPMNKVNPNEDQYRTGIARTANPALETHSIGGPDGTDIDFLPESIRQQRIRRRRLIRQGCLMALCVLAMALLTYIKQDQIVQARKNLAELQQCRLNLQRQVAMIEPLEKQLADLLIKKRIDTELGSRTDCTAVLAELCRVTPPSVVMTSIDLRTVDIPIGTDNTLTPRTSQGRFRSAGSVVSAGAYDSRNKTATNTVRRIYMTFTGLAPTDVDVANFIGQLASSPFFENVSMGYAKTVIFRERPVREFRIGCYLVR